MQVQSLVSAAALLAFRIYSYTLSSVNDDGWWLQLSDLIYCVMYKHCCNMSQYVCCFCLPIVLHSTV